MNSEKRRAKLFCWLRLIRLPKLLTVPGDALVGMFAAAVTTEQSMTWNRFPAVLVILLCLYAMAMIINDCFDLTEDWHRGRWGKPLVAGEISFDRACGAALLSMAIALFIAWLLGTPVLIVTLVIMGLIFFYNFFSRHLLVLSTMAMGLCRGSAVVLAALAQSLSKDPFPWPVLLTAMGIAGYIMIISFLAKRNDKPRELGREIFSPAWYVFVLFILISFTSFTAGASRIGLGFGVVVFIALLLRMLRQAIVLFVAGIPHQPSTCRQMTNRLGCWIIVIQAGLISMLGNGAGIAAAVLMITVMLPLQMRLSRIFSNS